IGLADSWDEYLKQHPMTDRAMLSAKDWREGDEVKAKYTKRIWTVDRSAAADTVILRSPDGKSYSFFLNEVGDLFEFVQKGKAKIQSPEGSFNRFAEDIDAVIERMKRQRDFSAQDLDDNNDEVVKMLK